MTPTLIDTDNPEFQNALKLIQYTRQSVFLTGKAGTGKSTFLKYVCQHTKKKYVVLAPTGIAAINAGGSTLHSFFKLPFHPLLPDDPKFQGRKLKDFLKYSSDHRKLTQNIELIKFPWCGPTSSTLSTRCFARTLITYVSRSVENSCC